MNPEPKLPLVDEIKEARRLANEASASMNLLGRVSALAGVVEVLRHQLDRVPGPVTIPGDDLVEDLVRLVPALASIRELAAPVGAPSTAAVGARLAQLDAARQVLTPLARRSEALSGQLHALQHEQRHHLEAPGWADAAQKLVDLGAERNRLNVELLPMRTKLAMLGPIGSVLDSFVARLSAALEGPRDAGSTERAVGLGAALQRTVSTLAAELKLEIRIPPPPAPGWEGVEQLHRELVGLRIDVDAVTAGIRREHDLAQHELDRVNGEIVDRMG